MSVNTLIVNFEASTCHKKKQKKQVAQYDYKQKGSYVKFISLNKRVLATDLIF